MTKPNFFIVGAPKCGTTSLGVWLGRHPEIFMSPVKEPHFFNDDENYVLTATLREYEEYFSLADRRHRAVGEASVWYLYSQSAVPNIERYSPGARYIVCLRNPVEMARSLHEEMVVNGTENIGDFESAWHLSDYRLAGDRVTSVCREPRHLAYANVCKLGSQLQRLLRHVEADRIHVVVLEDVRLDPRNEYLKILTFLGLADDGKSEFDVHNSAKEILSPRLRTMTKLLGHIKSRFSFLPGLGILAAVDRRNIRYRTRPLLSNAMRNELSAYFRQDIDLLGQILNRNFDNWYKSRCSSDGIGIEDAN